MNDKKILLERLEAIGRSASASGHAVALFGLGSVGMDVKRLDEYSDLDFFLIVEPGFKQRYIDNLDWLSSIVPLAYQFRNTVDGYKVLFADGVFGEFAVFEESELSRIPFAPGRIIWKRPEVTATIAIPAQIPKPPDPGSVEWHLGEALTNLYVGMSRFKRGEKLSAERFVQHFAVDRVMALYELRAKSKDKARDPFSYERRLEQRYPDLAGILPNFVQGYERTPESASAILEYLCREFVVNEAMKQEIKLLCEA